jgi:hypothetical protein
MVLFVTASGVLLFPRGEMAPSLPSIIEPLARNDNEFLLDINTLANYEALMLPM